MFMALSAFAQTQNIQVGNQTRNMIVYAPSGLPENSALIISLHGMNQDAAYQKNAAKFEPIADQEKFVVVFPNGKGKQWDISGNSDLDFLSAIIDDMVSRYKIDRNRVYVSGFSMGGMMCYHVANNMADKIAAIAPVSGYMLYGGNATSSRPMPIIHTHGNADDVVTYSNVGSYLQKWRTRNSCPATAQTTKPYPASKPASVATKDYWGPCDNSEVVLITLAGKGHWYSTDEASVHTSKEIWAFFKKWSLGPTITIPEHRDSIFNGDFSLGKAAWTLNVWAGGATGSIVNDEYEIKVDSVGTENHQIQLIQSGIILTKDSSYEMTFDAYAASNRTLEVNVEMEDDPWTSYLEDLKTFDLTTTKQTFTVKFTMSESTDSSGRISFNAGASTGTVYLDNVSIKTYTPATNLQMSQRNGQPGLQLSLNHTMLSANFVASAHQQASLNLYDLAGHLVKSSSWMTGSGQEHSAQLDMSGMARGLYIVRLTVGRTVMASSEILLAR